MKHASHLPSDRSKCPQIPSPTFPGSLENLGLSHDLEPQQKTKVTYHVYMFYMFFYMFSHDIFQIPCVSPSLRQTYTEF